MGKKPDHWKGSVRILQGAEKDIEGVNNIAIQIKNYLTQKQVFQPNVLKEKKKKIHHIVI